MYNQYAQQAANMIPQYEELAYNRWRDEGQDMYNRLAMYQNADATDYGRYRDRVGDFQAMLNYYTGLADTAYDRGANRYNTDYSNAYNMWRAQQADEQDARDYAERVRQYNESLAWDKEKYYANLNAEAAAAAAKYARQTYTDPNTNITYSEEGIPVSHNLEKRSGVTLNTPSTTIKGTTPSASGKTGTKTLSTSVQNEIRNEMGKIKGQITQEDVMNLAKKYINAGYNKDEVLDFLDEYYRKAGYGSSGGGGKKTLQTK